MRDEGAGLCPGTAGNQGNGLDLLFSVLGPLSIRGGGDEVVLTQSKPVLILGSLLLHANSLVSHRYLRSALWGEEPPAGGAAAVHSAVLRLRKLLAKYGFSSDAGDVLETFPGGYRIIADAGTLDLIAFRRAVAAAHERQDPRAEATLLGRALDLWRGEPLANLDCAVLRDSAAAVSEERIDAAICRNEIELALGNYRSMISELRGWTRECPGNEMLAAQLMEALYCSGRQVEALAEFERVRHYMGEQFGLDPGHVLQRAHLTIVRGDEFTRALAVPPRIEIESARPACKFPLDIPDFRGREHEEKFLADRIGPGSVVVVSGPPGIGKTAFAVHLASHLSSRFPRLCFVTVGPDGSAEAPAPAEEGLLVLDDVQDITQVLPAIDGNQGSAIVVTSRFSLAQLAISRGVTLWRLGPLARPESVRFLADVLGRDRVEAEEGTADQLAELCGDHPMSLRLAATKLSLRRARSLSSLADGIRSAGLTALDISGQPNGSVSARLADYERSLGPEYASALRALGGAPHRPLTPGECVTVLGRSPQRAIAILDRLTEASLLEHDDLDHYWMPEFLRSYVTGSADGPSAPDGPET
jgi:DNA-binding SARP family transcriptional activator